MDNSGIPKEKGFQIRPSLIEDVDRFNEIEIACFSARFRYGPSTLVGLISTSQENTALTAVIEDNVVGFIIGEIDNNNELLGRITTIQVDPNFQRKRIGSSLLISLESQFITTYQLNSVELQVHYQNVSAISFYRFHGYYVMKELRNYYSRKEHALLMKKKLTQSS